MLSGGGGANSAPVTRVCCALFKYKDRLRILTRKFVSLRLTRKVYVACVRSAMVYRSETLAMNVEQIKQTTNTDDSSSH